MNDKIYQCKETQAILSYQDWVEVYQSKIQAWDTLTSEQLVQAAIILKDLKEVK